MINNFNLNEKLKEKTAKIDEKTPKNAEKVATKTISWGELLIICFFFAVDFAPGYFLQHFTQCSPKNDWLA